MPKILIILIGLLAQALFSARVLVQWIMSERAKKVLSPSLFWIISIIASYTMFIYGWLRDDFSIMLGQVIAYYIYIWNIKIKGIWEKIHSLFRILLIATPVAGICYILSDWNVFVENCFSSSNIPTLLLIYGSAGQVIFTLRFVYQFFYSKRRNESILPLGFWIISLTGSTIIVSYGLFRLDVVLILGQAVGLISYIRNIIIYKKERETASR